MEEYLKVVLVLLMIKDGRSKKKIFLIFIFLLPVLILFIQSVTCFLLAFCIPS